MHTFRICFFVVLLFYVKSILKPQVHARVFLVEPWQHRSAIDVCQILLLLHFSGIIFFTRVCYSVFFTPFIVFSINMSSSTGNHPILNIYGNEKGFICSQGWIQTSYAQMEVRDYSPPPLCYIYLICDKTKKLIRSLRAALARTDFVFVYFQFALSKL